MTPFDEEKARRAALAGLGQREGVPIDDTTPLQATPLQRLATQAVRQAQDKLTNDPENTVVGPAVATALDVLNPVPAPEELGAMRGAAPAPPIARAMKNVSKGKTADKVSPFVKDKTPEQIRKTFNAIKKDLDKQGIPVPDSVMKHKGNLSKYTNLVADYLNKITDASGKIDFGIAESLVKKTGFDKTLVRDRVQGPKYVKRKNSGT